MQIHHTWKLDAAFFARAIARCERENLTAIELEFSCSGNTYRIPLPQLREMYRLKLAEESERN